MIPLLLLLFAFGSSNCQVLETRLGSIEATQLLSRNGRPYLSYSRIPYGKAPVGQLRFAAPQPHGPWEEMIPAGLPVPMCPQRFFFAPPGLGFMGQEDCLFLTINRPKTDAKNLPVVVYVHGGAFVMGEGGPPSSARYLMDQDIIFITLNYRLGALGFLGLNDTKFSGNYGLKDQILAINWIYENIVDYGGNPDQIYPIGESAGGVFAHLLLLTPGSRDQIAGSIALSGSDSKTCSSVPPRRLKFYAEQVALKLGCDRDSVEEILACFRDVEDHFAFIRVASELSPCIVSSPIFTPTIEPPSPEAVITGKLKPSKKPIIASFAAGEYLLPFDLMGIPGPGELRISQMKEDFFGYNRRFLEHRIPDDKLDMATQKLIKRYFKQKTNSPDEWLLDNAMIFQDYCFVYPALDLADRHEGPVWLYQLVHRGEVSLSDLKKKSDSKIACHADDKLMYFNMRERFPFAKPKERDEDVRVSEELIGYLMNLIKFGEPAPEGKPVKWEPFQKSGQILRVFTNGSEAADKKFLNEHREILKFWRELVEYDHSHKEEL